MLLLYITSKSMRFYLNINERQTYTHDFFFNNINGNNENYNNLIIKEIHIPFLFRNIDAQDHIFTIQFEGGAIQNLSIPYGNYTLTQLLNEIINVVNTNNATANFSYTYNEPANTVTFTSVLNFFLYGPVNTINRTIFNIFTSTTTPPTAYSTTFTTGAVDINRRLRHIYLSLNLPLHNPPLHFHSQNSEIIRASKNELLKLSLSKFKYGDTINFEFNDETHKFKLDKLKKINSLNVTFYDSLGNELKVEEHAYIYIHLN